MGRRESVLKCSSTNDEEQKIHLAHDFIQELMGVLYDSDMLTLTAYSVSAIVENIRLVITKYYRMGLFDIPLESLYVAEAKLDECDHILSITFSKDLQEWIVNYGIKQNTNQTS